MPKEQRWPSVRLKNLCSESAVYGANIPADEYSDAGVRFIRTTDITERGDLRAQGVFGPHHLVEQYLLKDGDILLSRSGTVGRTFLYEKDKHGPCSYAGYLVKFRASNLARPRFINYCAQSPFFQSMVQEAAISSTIENVNAAKYANFRIPLPHPKSKPPLSGSSTTPTSRSGGTSPARSGSSPCCREERQALVHQAVTRGLDPNVKLKDSGVEWLEDVPEHWRIRKGKRLFSPRRELANPNDIQLSATQAYGVIPQDEYERRIGRRIVKVSLHLEKRQHVEVDDFVISMRSFQGGLERAWATGCVRSSYVVLRPTQDVDVGFLQLCPQITRLHTGPAVNSKFYPGRARLKL